VDGWTGPVQWFERDRLEDHGPQGVLAGRLGARLLELQGRPWETFPRVSEFQVPPGCVHFPQTGHSLCDPFLSYWRNNGGLDRFGFPITEPFIETIGDWEGSVQYFERRRMELHVELPGIPILLGLLGSEVLTYEVLPPPPVTPGVPTPPTPGGPVPACVDRLLPGDTFESARLRSAYEQLAFRETLGCPVEYLFDRPAAVQRMERGDMVWVDLTASGGRIPTTLVGRFIYAIFDRGTAYQRYNDTWVAGRDPYIIDLPAPPGLYTPTGGFGKLWVEDSNLRDRIGWAVERLPDEGPADVVVFDNVYNDPANLGALILFHDTGVVYAFGRLDMRDEVQVVLP
jgi:hypothetical protein